MPKQGIVAFEDAYITITDYPRADEAIVHYNDGTVETIVSGYSAESMNYEIYNMVEAIKGTQPNRSLFFTTEVIDILDQMQNYGRIKELRLLPKFSFYLFSMDKYGLTYVGTESLHECVHYQ